MRATEAALGVTSADTATPWHRWLEVIVGILICGNTGRAV
jgi:hypothetical protein